MNKQLAAVFVAALAFSQPVLAVERNPEDPYEPYNRVMFKVNDTADQYVIIPFARGYRAVTPTPVRMGVSNFFYNLRDVISFGSNLLRLDLEKASTDLVRVGINTTFGLGGLINIADAGDMPNNKNSLGDTLATWGWKHSNYFVYPLAGPSTVRDSLGNMIVGLYPPENGLLSHSNTLLVATKVLKVADTREQYLNLTSSLDQAAVDKYAYTRDMYMRIRNQQVGIAPPPDSSDIDIDELVAPDNTPDSIPDSTPADTPASSNTPTDADKLGFIDTNTDLAAITPEKPLWTVE